jgi:hypothetical protein
MRTPHPFARADRGVWAQLSSVRFAVAIALLPTIAFILHDFAFQLPDNEGDITIGFVVTIVGLLLVWACSGYAVARHVKRGATRAIAGAVIAAMSIGILWLAFLVLNTLFIERMSYEPDRILAFHRSGYATWREWWNHNHGSGPFPLLGCVAAVVGAISGGMRALHRRPRRAATAEKTVPGLTGDE